MRARLICERLIRGKSTGPLHGVILSSCFQCSRVPAINQAPSLPRRLRHDAVSRCVSGCDKKREARLHAHLQSSSRACSLRSSRKYLNYIANYRRVRRCLHADQVRDAGTGAIGERQFRGCHLWMRDYRSVNCIDNTIKSRQRADWQNVDTRTVD